MKRSIDKKSIVYNILGILFIFILWLILSNIYNNSLVLPKIKEVFEAFGKLVVTSRFYSLLYKMVIRILLTVIISLFISMLLAIASFKSKRVYYFLNPLITILLMGLCMTLLELIGGLIFLKAGVRLWDYRDRKFNFKGVICPTFTIIWTLAGALYYFFLATPVLNALEWFSNNLSFSYITVTPIPQK